jgi:hypothetical protein
MAPQAPERRIRKNRASKMTLVVWTNLTVSLDGKVTANALMLKVLDQIYVLSPLPPSPSPITSAKPVGVGAASQPWVLAYL